MPRAKRIFATLAQKNHEQVAFLYDEPSGLRAIVAIHDTTLGPALGGCRMRPYATEEDALHDVLRLSEAMTYKAAIAGLNLGGGKSVIIADPRTDKSELLFRTFGRLIEGFGGRYIPAEDMGTTTEDMELVHMETDFVAGLSQTIGGGGDPSRVTAVGVHSGIKASVKHKLGKNSISGMSVAIQGLGNVGMYLLKLLHEDGAELYVTDVDQKKVDKAVEIFGAKAVGIDEIYACPVDIFAPCAMGAIINDETIPQLKCSIIAGGANNQLQDSSKHGRKLMQKGILYAPDYVVNGGGLINAAMELEGYSKERAFQKAHGIYDTLERIFALAEREQEFTEVASYRLAKERLKEALFLKKIYKP